MSSQSSLAQELIDTIVNLCSDHYPTLAQLSLVSQQMRESSARHLYSQFDFNEEINSPTLTTLAQILTTSPHLALNIHRLVINLNFLFDSSIATSQSEESVELDLSSLRLIFSRAQRVERLAIWGYTYFETDYLSSKLESLPFHTYEWPLLTHLEVYGSIPILPIMGVHNAVKSLTVDDSYCKQRMWKDVTVKAGYGRLVRLRELWVHDTYEDVHDRQLFGPHPPIDLSQLCVLGLIPGYILPDGLFARLLDRASPTLEVFHLSLENLILDQEMPTLLRLPLPRLHTLHIKFPALMSLGGGAYTSQEKTQHAIEFAACILEGLTRPNHAPGLRSVTIQMKLSGTGSEQIRTWLNFSRLARVLTQIAEHGRLREIRVAFIDRTRSSTTFSEPDFWKDLMETDLRGISGLKGVVLTLDQD